MQGVERPQPNTSLNTTVPVAFDGKTVATKVMGWPLFDGFGVDDRTVVVLPLSVMGEDTLPP
jgi:hypothetical protein